MRIVLSRKGFDSGYGRAASPILPDRSLVSLPIPAVRAAKRYGDVRFKDRNIGDIAAALTRGAVRHDHPLHLDPDLTAESLPRREGWRPAFGQEKAAQSHLASSGVGPGDLFLFFGWFRETEEGPNGLRYRRGAPDIHALFGWLQVDYVIRVDDRIEENRALRPWLADHPHLNAHAAPGNTVYVATERLVIGDRDLGVPGGGTFQRYREGLRLTRDGGTRSVWRLPGWFLPESGPVLTYHRDPARWIREDDGSCTMKAVAKGQEFVFDATGVPEAIDWIAGLVNGARTTEVSVRTPRTGASPQPAAVLEEYVAM